MIPEVGFLIGNSIGECISVETEDNEVCLGTYIRTRLKFEISQPLKMVVNLTLDPVNPSVGILLRYEKLPDYCYVCGIIGHQLKKCHIKDYVLASQSGKYLFGAWLRDEEEGIMLPPVDLILQVTKTLNCGKQALTGEILSHRKDTS